MPIHDWTRVSAGVWHDFHCSWVPRIKDALNGGILPDEYYAQVEQTSGGAIADVLTLESASEEGGQRSSARNGISLVAEAPPQVALTIPLEQEVYSARRRTLAIRHSSSDRVVAFLEVLSPGNKSSRRALRSFARKAINILRHGVHLLVIDLFPPTKPDTNGIHGVIWEELGGGNYQAPSKRPLTLVSYAAGVPKVACVEPASVGDTLKAMPLFLTATEYVSVPLEVTYMSTWQAVPRRWRKVIES